ncbi:MAG: tyrosine-type recombinase/integrase [Verrucomicrobiae bacterium]
MAGVIRRPESSCWIACFKDVLGRRLKRTTKIPAKERDRRRALEVAEGFEAVASKKRTALFVRRVISDLHLKITGEAMAIQSLRQYVESWLAMKAHSVEPSTLLTYNTDTKKLIEFMGDRADEDIAELSKQDLLNFRSAEMKTLSPNSVNDRISVLKMLFKSARREGLISDNPAEDVDAVRGAKRKPKPVFTIAQLRAVLAAADEEWKSMILFGLYTGQRLGDVAVLTWGDLDLSARELRLETQKTGRIVVQSLAGPLLKHVQSLTVAKEKSAPVHPNAFADFHRAKGSTSHLSGQFVDLLRRVGLREKQVHRKTHGKGRGVDSGRGGLAFHCLRHTAVTMLKTAGIPAAAVMELTGHSSKEMSEHYTHIGLPALKLAAESFPDLMQVKPKGKKTKK